MTDPSAGRPRVVLLAAPGASTNCVRRALERTGADVVTLLEQHVSPRVLLRGRVRRLGWWPVVGQVLFLLLVVPILERRGRGRIQEILAKHGLDAAPLPEPVIRVSSVNSDDARQALRSLQPSVVVVNGTRIISAATLECVSAPFVNMHAGVTPRYRGVHGGYWALAEGRPDLVGTTVHLVDTGVDTGTVLSQVRFRPTDRDTYATYPYLHLAAGMPDLVRVVTELAAGQPPHPVPVAADAAASRLRYHPTIWQYLAARLRHGVR